MRKTIIPILLGLATSTSALAQLPKQDCFFAERIFCTASIIEDDAFSGPGSNESEINPTGSSNAFSKSCFANYEPIPSNPPRGEKHSIWYVLTPEADGDLFFSIDPSKGPNPNANADYDWVVYNLDNAPAGTPVQSRCGAIFENHATMVARLKDGSPACNAVRNAGVTGANDQAGAWNGAPVSVTKGNTYVICVNRFSENSSSFEIDFTATNPAILDSKAPEIEQQAAQSVLCTQTTFSLFFDEPLDCSSIANDDVQLTAPSGAQASIASISGNDCTPQYSLTSGITITLTAGSTLEAGDYTVTIVTGSDNNTLLDACQNEIAPGTVAGTFTVACADFSVDNSAPCIDKDIVTFTNLTNGDASWTYEWDFDGDGTVDATGVENQTYTYTATGNFDPILTVTKTGQTPSQSQNVAVAPIEGGSCSTPDIYWPTAFSPNGDGINETFGPSAQQAPDQITMYIVNRWGEVVFQSADINDRWDGKINGNNVVPGVYAIYAYYKLNPEDNDIEYKGTITITP